MRTYTCDRCQKTEENPKDWLIVETTPLHTSKFDPLTDENEYHYCSVCAARIQHSLTLKKPLFSRVCRD